MLLRADSFERCPEQISGGIHIRHRILNHTMRRGSNHSCFIKLSLFLAERMRNFVRYHEYQRRTQDKAQTLNTCLQEIERELNDYEYTFTASFRSQHKSTCVNKDIDGIQSGIDKYIDNQ